ncbi:MAG: bacteriohemerythrin [Negativicutes bacterium]|nr:bacteriohemerythrin [Negativicutes bacterium]MDR3592645.1 bacteriohemerythrin [Negativicutes bacterium]
MAFMAHDETLLTGIKAIDDQHNRLVELINDMYDQVLKCETVEEEQVFAGRFLIELRKYAKTHFADEERMLTEHKYPDLLDHQAEHRIFVKELEKLERRFEHEELALSIDVFLFARDWIAHHLNHSDRDYFPYIK